MAKRIKPISPIQGPAKEGNQYDKILKENILLVTPFLLRRILGLSNYRLAPLPQLRLQTTLEKEPDFMQMVYDNKTPEGRLLHIELDGQDLAENDWRMKEYNGIAGKVHLVEIEQHLIYYGLGKPKKMKGRLKDTFYTFRYKLHCISDVGFQEFLNTESPDEVVFAIWGNMQGHKPEEVIKMILQRLWELIGDKLKLRKFIKQLLILSQKRNLRQVTVNQINIMQEIKDYEYDPYYLIGEEKGIEKGIEIGKEEGIEKGIEIGKEKGIEIGEEKGVIEANILAIRNMSNKKFEKAMIADLLEVEVSFVEKTQKQLLKEPKILALIKEGFSAAHIAKSLRVSALFVDVLKKTTLKKEGKKNH